MGISKLSSLNEDFQKGVEFIKLAISLLKKNKLTNPDLNYVFQFGHVECSINGESLLITKVIWEESDNEVPNESNPLFVNNKGKKILDLIELIRDEECFLEQVSLTRDLNSTTEWFFVRLK